VFYVVVAANLLASVMAIALVKPMRARMARRALPPAAENELPHAAVIAGEALR
jgi:hypothetical protein